MCTGAEPAAAGAAKGAAEVAGGTGLVSGGGLGLTAGGGLGLTATGLTGGLAGVTGFGTGGLTAAGIIGGLKTAATILSPVASLVSAASGISASRRMGSAAAAPAIAPTIAMPTFGGPISFQAQQTSLASQLQRRGRASTILTMPYELSDKLGS